VALCLLALSFVLPQPAHAILNPVAIHGVVTDGVNPIKDALVTVYDADGFELDWYFTDLNGSYEFLDLPVGTYYLEASADKFETQRFGGVDYSGVTVTKDFALVSLQLAFKGTLTDRVTRAPIVDASVSALDQVTEDTFEGYTALDGTYEIYAPAGTYVLQTDAYSYDTSSVAGLVFSGGVTPVIQDFALVPLPLAFKGVVTDKITGDPIADAYVYAADQVAENGYETTTAQDGTYELFAPAGTYDLEVGADSYHDAQASGIVFNGSTPLVKNFALVPPTVTRLYGNTRYETAEKLARKGWDPAGNKSWPGVQHIIIANGQPGREADPIGAAGLSGALGAPVVLTAGSALDPAAKRVITEIALKNPGVEVHIIGGTTVMPDARWNDIKRIPGVSQVKDRISGLTRYGTSVEIANAIIDATGAESLNGLILIAGDNPAAFFDGLAASPISASNGMPMLLVKKTSIPTEVSGFLATAGLDLASLPRYAASGTTYLGASAVGATRMATSSNRYAASAQIANFAIEQGWASEQDTALASNLPDALTGGAFMGNRYGVLLFTDSTKNIQLGSRTFIEENAGWIIDGWVIGGTTVLPTAQETTFRNLIQ